MNKIINFQVIFFNYLQFKTKNYKGVPNTDNIPNTKSPTNKEK